MGKFNNHWGCDCELSCFDGVFHRTSSRMERTELLCVRSNQWLVTSTIEVRVMFVSLVIVCSIVLFHACCSFFLAILKSLSNTRACVLSALSFIFWKITPNCLWRNLYSKQPPSHLKDMFSGMKFRDAATRENNASNQGVLFLASTSDPAKRNPLWFSPQLSHRGCFSLHASVPLAISSLPTRSFLLLQRRNCRGLIGQTRGNWNVVSVSLSSQLQSTSFRTSKCQRMPRRLNRDWGKGNIRCREGFVSQSEAFENVLGGKDSWVDVRLLQPTFRGIFGQRSTLRAVSYCATLTTKKCCEYWKQPQRKSAALPEGAWTDRAVVQLRLCCASRRWCWCHDVLGPIPSGKIITVYGIKQLCGKEVSAVGPADRCALEYQLVICPWPFGPRSLPRVCLHYLNMRLALDMVSEMARVIVLADAQWALLCKCRRSVVSSLPAVHQQWTLGFQVQRYTLPKTVCGEDKFVFESCIAVWTCHSRRRAA